MEAGVFRAHRCQDGPGDPVRLRRQAGDPLLAPLVYLLTGLGLALISRLAPAFITRQLFWLVIASVSLLSAALGPKNLNWLGFRSTFN